MQFMPYFQACERYHAMQEQGMTILEIARAEAEGRTHRDGSPWEPNPAWTEIALRIFDMSKDVRTRWFVTPEESEQLDRLDACMRLEDDKCSGYIVLGSAKALMETLEINSKQVFFETLGLLISEDTPPPFCPDFVDYCHTQRMQHGLPPIPSYQ